LKWLRIHLSNVYGFDKASLTEREQFAVQHEKDIFSSATNPLGDSAWWLTAENPWQCLAACYEIKAALDSGDPARFVSYLPIHQDGTCNGLQHYAALGGDEWGAKQVNLEPGDRPADVYSAVADLVKEGLAKDLIAGHECAQILDGKITRKVVKQTVMTNVYGVTFIGAQAQVRKQLIAAHPDLPNTARMNPTILATYVARKIFAALSTMFKGAHDIQYWLGECASRISLSVTPEQLDRVRDALRKVDTERVRADRAYTAYKGVKAATELVIEHMAFKSSVVWTNPLRMPIVQPYRVAKARRIETNLQTINISDPHRSDPVSKRKQLQGFPPNFVHSLDATHMILSALQCDKMNMSFAAVHDSFWTHDADVEKMNVILRDAFIRMHSEDIVGRLAAEFAVRYKGSIHLAKIRPGTEFYERVVAWRKSRPLDHTFSYKGFKAPDVVRMREALLEQDRLKLLASDDPAEVEKGRKMVTPGSIFESMAAEKDLGRSDDLTEIALGTITVPDAKAVDQDSANISPMEDDNILDDMMNEESLDEEDECMVAEPQPNDKSSFAARILGKEAQAGKRKPQTKKQEVTQWAWLPISFPPVPKRVCY
jgi:DNA-directed RNA polymerase